jgi:alpha-galactosidase
LQPLYWGGRLGARDTIAPAHSFPEIASFDSPYTTTPQEYAAWGAGLFTEPALKITFADGNRDLVLHFVHATSDGAQSLEVLLKDISREIYVILRYTMDADSGILARSASIENREKQSVIVEQAAAAQWTLPPARYTLSETTAKSGSARWLERLLAHHRRAGSARRGPRHRRLQSLRFWLRPASRRVARDAGLLRRLFRSRARRRFAAAASLRNRPHSAARPQLPATPSRAR